MLTEIDTVDWNSLRHAHGPASDIPDLLKQLAQGYDEGKHGILHETLWHQGTIYSASAAALPFLFEIAAAGQVSQPNPGVPYEPTPGEFAVSLICCIATGEGWLQYELRTTSIESAQKRLTSQNRFLESEFEVERKCLASIKECMDSKLHILYPYFGSPEGLGEFVSEVIEQLNSTN